MFVAYGLLASTRIKVQCCLCAFTFFFLLKECAFTFERYVLRFEYETLEESFYSWDLINYRWFTLTMEVLELLSMFHDQEWTYMIFMVDYFRVFCCELCFVWVVKYEMSGWTSWLWVEATAYCQHVEALNQQGWRLHKTKGKQIGSIF